ncbi:MAG: hypothetical protein IPM66_16945 [Acidobacteriota bacterium]|nr:MAG: hypothetical protein IPM66_16945 [Acidobacteriota bacterium]
MEQNQTTDKQRGGDQPSTRRRNHRVIIFFVPMLIPVLYFLFFGKNDTWTAMDLAIIGLIIAFYSAIVFLIGLRIFRHKQNMRAISLASPLIEVPLSHELRNRLSAFAALKEQKLAVAAFELLDREIPRFDLDEERDRARRDNEHLRQQAGQGAFIVAVTTEILRRLLLLSGAREEDRKFWRSQISQTAARIVSDALDHRLPISEQTS